MIIEAAGRTLPELMEDSGRRLFAAVTDPADVGEALREKIVVEGKDPSNLLVEWVNALLELAQIQHILLKSCRVGVKDLPEGGLRGEGEILGELFDPHRHVYRAPGRCRKADLRQGEGGMQVQYYF